MINISSARQRVRVLTGDAPVAVNTGRPWTVTETIGKGRAHADQVTQMPKLAEAVTRIQELLSVSQVSHPLATVAGWRSSAAEQWILQNYSVMCVLQFGLGEADDFRQWPIDNSPGVCIMLVDDAGEVADVHIHPANSISGCIRHPFDMTIAPAQITLPVQMYGCVAVGEFCGWDVQRGVAADATIVAHIGQALKFFNTNTQEWVLCDELTTTPNHVGGQNNVASLLLPRWAR